MNVTFSLRLRGRGLVPEEQLARDFAGTRNDLLGALDLDGSLTLHGDGAAFEMPDDLGYLSITLLDALPALKEGKKVDFLFYLVSGGARLEPEGDAVRVFVKDKDVGRYPQKEFSAVLRACVARVADTLERLSGGDINVLGKVEALRQRLA